MPSVFAEALRTWATNDLSGSRRATEGGELDPKFARHPTLRIVSSSRAIVTPSLVATSVFFTVRPPGSR